MFSPDRGQGRKIADLLVEEGLGLIDSGEARPRQKAEAQPGQIEEGRPEQADKQAIPARGLDPEHADARGLGIADRENRHRREQREDRCEEQGGLPSPDHPGNLRIPLHLARIQISPSTEYPAPLHSASLSTHVICSSR